MKEIEKSDYMFIEQKLEQVKLSSSQQAVADYLISQRRLIKDMTILELAKETYTSTATVIRLAKKLGYQGFDDLKKDYLKEIEYLDTHFCNVDPNFPFERGDNIQQIAYKVTQVADETIHDTCSLIEHDSLQKAVYLLKNAKKIHLCAISYCLMLGQIFKMDMLRIGKNVNIYDISGDELFLPAIVEEKDCVIFISYSGQIDKLCLLAKILKQKGIQIIVISALGQNELKQYGDVVLNISTREKLYSKVKGYSNELSVLMILDILYSCYYALDYEGNKKKRQAISKSSEYNRFSTLEVMKED
ncbi:MurR/RpiR family transcriptional regulator [Candidatus Stoquefichus massiliensis]|uniref:MurR/RpiR family transcriptional regulator n=1 Tax=Candidatus Stoquefichus massiliensis TaxID=1470350 RepID=UPI0004B3B0E9|nr:MurR/RpiR family transcriptional regulator [Candidatus Stoquefichus massiliensis]